MSRLFLLLAIILTACTSRNVKVAEGMLVVDVSEVREGEDVNVETLAESVEAIRLENCDDAFFEFSQAWLSDNYVVVKGQNEAMRAFGRDGRYLGMLEGVDERTFVYDVAIDDRRGVIYASMPNCDSVQVFGLDGQRKEGIGLKGYMTKAVLAADSCGLALAQFDFSDRASGFNAALVTDDGVRYCSRPSLKTTLRGPEGNIIGFNNEIFGGRTGGRFMFMTTFCDTLFRYDEKENRIIPEIAVDIPNRHKLNAWDFIQEPLQEFNLLRITALPSHYIVKIYGTGGRSIIVDREAMKAWRGEIVWKGIEALENVEGIENFEILKPRFYGDYAYTVIPPVGAENATIIRWKLGTPPQPSPTGEGALKSLLERISNTKACSLSKEDDARLTAILNTNYSSPSPVVEGQGGIDSIIARTGLKRGHPALAYAYAVKSVLMTQMEQMDSAEFYRRLINAPLTHRQQNEINQRMMEVLTGQGDYRAAQQYAIALSRTNDNGLLIQMAEDRSQITELDQQIAEGSRTRTWLIAALVAIVATSPLLIIYMRRRRRQHRAAHRELLTNHAIIRRIKAAPQHPLSDKEEKTLHRVVTMLYPTLAERLQQQAATPLSERELTICFLIRLGTPQPAIASLLDWKPATFRVAKSRLKRDRLQLPAEVELEGFVCGA